MSKIEKWSNNKNVAEVIRFMDSPQFPLCVGGAALLFYLLHISLLSIALFLALATFICLFSKDTRPMLSLVLLIVQCLRYKDGLEPYLSPLAICTYALFVPPFLFALGYRLLYRRVEWERKSGLYSMAFLALVFLLGGVFSEYYTVKNFIYALTVSGLLFGLYVFFAFTLENRGDNLLYLARVCAVCVCLIALQVVECYLYKYKPGTVFDYEWKVQVHTGWAHGNMTAEMITFCLPAVFYLIYREKRGAFYWLVVALALAAILLTMCRNALLWAVATCFVGLIVCCVKGENKVFHRCCAFLLGCIVLAVAVFLITRGQLFPLIEKVLTKLFSGDSGRSIIWKQHLELFVQSPLQGVGFETYGELGFVDGVTKAHNSLVQVLAGGGVIGLYFYFLHRIQTIEMILKKRTPDRLFVGGCILVAILMAQLSSTFFHSYSIIYYAVVLVFLEKSLPCKSK